MVKVLLKSGVVKEVSAKDAKLLVLVKRATLVAEEPEAKAEHNPEAEAQESGDAKPKRAYKRKDMAAEK
jgi:hypothetical protein